MLGCDLIAPSTATADQDRRGLSAWGLGAALSVHRAWKAGEAVRTVFFLLFSFCHERFSQLHPSRNILHPWIQGLSATNHGAEVIHLGAIIRGAEPWGAIHSGLAHADPARHHKSRYRAWRQSPFEEWYSRLDSCSYRSLWDVFVCTWMQLRLLVLFSKWVA